MMPCSQNQNKRILDLRRTTPLLFKIRSELRRYSFFEILFRTEQERPSRFCSELRRYSFFERGGGSYDGGRQGSRQL
ncbi:hypothetical protein U1Q18_020643 [Sarracenia purpurea var. burkii]